MNKCPRCGNFMKFCYDVMCYVCSFCGYTRSKLEEERGEKVDGNIGGCFVN